MNWMSWIGVGLLSGLIAKFVMPGRDPGGLIVTTLIGILGGMAGGYVSTRLGYGTVTGLNLPSIAIASAGAFGLLWVYRFFRR